MANEIQFRHDQTGRTLYAIVVNDDPDSADFGKYWDAGSKAWDALAVADWGDYDVPLSEDPADSYRYVASTPTDLPLGFYHLLVFEQAGASPAIGDAIVAERRCHYDASVFRDSTKTEEQILAVMAGKATHTAATGVTLFLYRDGSTQAASVTCTGSGTRSASALT